MTYVHQDQDIDLALDDPTTVRYVRPAQPYIIRSRIALIVGVLLVAAGGVAAFTGHITLESPAVPLLIAAVFVCGVFAYLFGDKAEQIDQGAEEE